MRAYLITALIALFAVSHAGAQKLAAYLDYMDRFWIFDDGEKQQVESYKLRDYQVGGKSVAYVSYGDDFKVYHNGSVRTLERVPPTEYYNTDYLLGYNMFSVLKVFEDGELRTLCNNTNGYIVEDSLIAYYDEVKQVLNVYQNGEIRTIEDGLLQWPITSYASGDNILAYITEFDNKFKIFYRGEVIVVDENVRETVYKAGRDIVGYMNLVTNAFMCFYKGKFYDLEAFEPRSFKMGDERMVWVNDPGDFKIFEDGVVTQISSFEPESYEVTDSTLTFIEDGFLKTFCDGQVYEIERYVPPIYKVDERTIAYVDFNKRIKAFRRCEPVFISYEMVNSLELERNIIVYNIGVNTVKIWYEGKLY